MDLQAESVYDAAYLYVAAAKSKEAAMMPSRGPALTPATVFEVVIDARVYRVAGRPCSAGL